MKYRVVVESRAADDLESAYRTAAEKAPATAKHWLRRFQKALESLSRHPHRCWIALEDELVEEEIRQFVFGKGRGASIWRAVYGSRKYGSHLAHTTSRHGRRELGRSLRRMNSVE